MGWQTILLIIFWGIISLIYLTLLIRHLKWSRYEFSPLPKRPTVAKIMGVPLNIAETAEDINAFVDSLNKHNKKMNVAQFFGYLAAFVAAFASFITSLVTNI